MKKLFTVVFIFFITTINAQINMTPELTQKLTGKTKFQDIKNTVLTHYEQKLANLTTSDTVENKKIMRQLKMWNRKFWLEEFYTNNEGIVQPRIKVDLSGIETVKRNFSEATNTTARNNVFPWINHGPMNGNDGLGRFDKIAFHPSNPNIIFAGSPHGGLFKTTNGGNNWDAVSAFLPALGISGIAINPTNPDIIYILTGDGNSTDASLVNEYLYRSSSDGVYKTTDGGVSWFKTAGFPSLQNINYLGRDLIINPINPQILLAATSKGLFRTNNGGNSWINVNSGNEIYDVEFKPNDPNIVYACNSTFMKSEDGGLIFTDIPIAGLSGATRVSMAVTPANPAKVALFAGNRVTNSLVGVFISTNSGSNFNLVYNGAGNSEGNLFHSYIDIDAVLAQQNYNNTIAISPINENIILVGGLCIWSSYNGGSSWTQETAYYSASGLLHEYIHPDQHELKYQPDGTLYVANDGGVYKSVDNGDDWEFKSTGLVATQFYHFEMENDEEDIWGGAQDNGILEQTGSGGNYYTYWGGDGYDVITDHNYLVSNGEDDDIIYTVNKTIYKDCGTPSDCEIAVPDNNNFFGNLAMDPFDENIVYVGYPQGVFKSTSGGGGWNSVGGSGNWCVATGRNVSRVYAAGNGIANQSLFRLLGNPGAVFTNITPPPPYNINLKITDIDVDPLNANTLYISIGGNTPEAKVFMSTNGGNGWINLTYNLPNVPIFCIKRDRNNTLYVGTSIGVFCKPAGYGHWQYFSNNLPNVPVTEIEIFPEPNPVGGNSPAGPPAIPQVWISTFGRGIWYTQECSISCPANVNLPNTYHAGTYLWEASNELTSAKINGGGVMTNVKYSAGTKIILQEGFRAFKGTKFKTYLQPCGEIIPFDPVNVKIGDVFGGGKVAYILQAGDPGYDPDVQHGLIVAISTLQTNYGYYWIPIGASYPIDNFTDTVFGSGISNTNNIYNHYGNWSPKYAASQCYDLIESGYDDWYLPSKNELQKIYEHRTEMDMFQVKYWSSSQGTSYIKAFVLDFNNGVFEQASLTTTLIRVLPVRSF
jgi:photosystem II stability/assembly factor-like uncharacterized protein